MRAIETLGSFWLPKNKKQKVRGKLIFTKEKGIALELEGVLIKTPDMPCDIVLGENSDGEKYTLITCYLNTWSTSISFRHSRQSKRTSLFAKQLLVGAHFNHMEALKFKSAKFRCSNLESWVSARNFEWDSLDRTAERLFSITYGTKPYEPVIMRDKTKIGIMTEAPEMTHGRPIQWELSLVEKNFIVISPNRKEHLNKLLEEIYAMEFFLMLCIGEPQTLIEVILYQKNDEFYYWEKLELLFSPIQKDSKALAVFEMLISYPEISDKFEEVVQNWRNKYREFRDIWNSFLSIHLQPNMFLEPRFLLLAQALESYHRRKFDMDRGRQKAECDRIIKAQTDKEIEKYLKQKLQYAHEPSFKERFRDLIMRCPRLLYFRVLNHGTRMEEEDFLTQTKNARNYYTHYDKKLTKKVPDFGVLVNITGKLQLLMHYYILSELGFEEDWIIEKLSQKFR